MNVTPQVTVLMAVYNGAAYLREAVDSILAQTFGDLELLVVDDGSGDATGEILASYGDSRLRVIRNDTNRGLPAALNIGLRAARAPLVARLDADDRSHPSRLERQVRFLESHPEVALLGTEYRVIDERGLPVQRRVWPVCATAVGIRWQGLFGNPFAHSSVMFRRSVIVDELGGYDERMPAGVEDYDLWSRLRRKHVAMNLLEPLIDFRAHGSSVTAKQPSLLRMELLRQTMRSNLIATLGDGDYENLLDFWVTANAPLTYGRIASARRAMADLALIRARFLELYPEAAHEPEVGRATAASLAILSYSLAQRDRRAAARLYAVALRAHVAMALRWLPRCAASVILGGLLRRNG